ncbi:MAG: hypothetical protein F4X92_09065 [Gammaproteobacteria bacterium]|nr:hypothetical protein [Gammaproteobacteria bacterium]
MILNTSQVEFYRENGCLTLETITDASTLDKIRKKVDEFIQFSRSFKSSNLMFDPGLPTFDGLAMLPAIEGPFLHPGSTVLQSVAFEQHCRPSLLNYSSAWACPFGYLGCALKGLIQSMMTSRAYRSI